MLALVYQVPKLKKNADWGYRTSPQARLDERQMPWTRGKVIGGCSSVNGMLYLRGHRDNYDGWRDEGCRGWGYDDVLPYFKRSECHEDGESEFHGGQGPMHVSRQRGVSVVSLAFQEAVTAVCGVPMLDDFNGASQEGASTFQMTCWNRTRQSTSVAFLDPALGRANLTVVSAAHVTALVVEGGRAVGVRYQQGGEERTARASREVVLSAGTIGSPAILLRAGIGPADELRALGVPVVRDLRGVGKNLHDHLMVPLRFRATPDTGHRSTAAHFFGGLAAEYLFRRGWFGKTFLEGGAFVRSDPSAPRPDLQMHSIPWAYPEPNDDGPEDPTISTEHSFTLLPSLIYPKSRGEVRLASPDPFAAPVMDPRYLDDEADVRLLLRGVELSREFARTQPLARFLKSEATPGAAVQSEAEVRAFVRLYAKTVYHPVGTCRMGTGEDAVVDPELRVRGVDGLRVIDASIMPSIPGGNTNAPSIMIGEKGADLLRGRPAHAA
jgi:choline dehydrogenase-like flavoprotein